ncbi:hypothetical protein [Paenibacillus herberti]|uniref:BclB C-terminal domain-containing protein n=1 Tax=Paenibacillus herberti TaxID=1619309 RepID=A0A229P580_9BACL|nr:hypothetical protein [Paenibacillus herberti]OXM17217.1 hypothetical protein CGZ75_11590 [Paenibacillus herberti]
MSHDQGTKVTLHSYRPHSEEHCKPCPKPPQRNCIIPFTPLQADIFEGLLDDLIASIQSIFIPPVGPLPNVLKVLQNLFKDIRLTLRDQADLFAATELNITAYEQSDEWSVALIAATQQTLTELYSLSLLACVSSTVKDGWVTTIRLAETNLAGISVGVPPAIEGSVLSFSSGSSTMDLSLDSISGLPNGGVVVGYGFASRTIPVSADSAAAISIVLADSFGGNNYAFSMPRGGTLTAITASFILTGSYFIVGPPITIQAQLCRAPSSVSPYSPFTAIPGASVPLIPSLSGNISILTCQGSLAGLDIPLNPGDRLVVVFTAFTSSNAEADPTAILGSGSASITIGQSADLPPSEDSIIPFASVTPANLIFSSSNPFENGAGVIGYGFTETVPYFSNPILSLDTLFDQFTTAIPNGGTVTSFSAYFGVQSGQTLSGPVSINVSMYLFNASTNMATPLLGTSIQLPVLQPGVYTENSPGVYGIADGLDIQLSPTDRLVLVFIANGGSVLGWASGGVSVGA